MRLKVPFVYQPCLKRAAKNLLPQGLVLGSEVEIEIPEWSSEQAPVSLRIRNPQGDAVWRKMGSQWLLPVDLVEGGPASGISLDKLRELVGIGFVPSRDKLKGTAKLVASDVVMRARSGEIMYDSLRYKLSEDPTFCANGFIVSNGNQSEAAAEARKQWQSAGLCFVDGQCWQRVAKPILVLSSNAELTALPENATSLSNTEDEAYDLSEWAELSKLYEMGTGYSLESRAELKTGAAEDKSDPLLAM